MVGCVETLLGCYAKEWHKHVSPTTPELIMPNQMAMVVLRQLEKVLPLSDSSKSDEATEIDRLTKRASETYAAMVDNAKRMKL